MQFKDRLKKLRADKGITQEDLAIAIDVPSSSIRRFETAEGGLPRRERLTAIADYFGCSIDYLVGRTENPQHTIEYSEETKELLDCIDLSEEEIIKKIPLTIDGRKVTEDEYKWFIASIRAKRMMEEK